MKQELLEQAMGYLSDDHISEAASFRKPARARWLPYAAAACLCLAAVLAGTALHTQEKGTSVSRYADPSSSAAQAVSQPDKTPTEGAEAMPTEEGGVYLPPVRYSLSKPKGGIAADMIAFFIWQGRTYANHSDLCPASLAGEKMGTATGLINEWTEKDGYVDLAGSVEGDFYTVEGYDPAFVLCMPFADEQYMLMTCGSDITLRTGADLYDARLRLPDRVESAQMETRESWNYNKNELWDVPVDESMDAFVRALCESEVRLTDELLFPDGEYFSIYDNLERYHLYLTLEDGMSVHLRLLDGGVVIFPGLNAVYVTVPEEIVEAITK